MSKHARADRAEHLPSTAGTSAGRARRWPLQAGLIAVAALAVAIPMVASAEPASAPVQASATDATPATPISPSAAPFKAAGDATYLAGAHAIVATGAIDLTPPPAPVKPKPKPKPAPKPAVKPAPAPAPAPKPAPAPAPKPAPAPAAAPAGRCGGDLPPCWVMERESGGDITAKNPSSSASGKWQFINSTWAGYGGYAEARQAPESVQDAKARALWAGGRGCSHWAAC